MNNFIVYMRSIFLDLAKREQRSTDRQMKTLCPARSLCLGCDGDINCSLARLTIATDRKPTQ